MPRLQEFVGTRELPPKPPMTTSGFTVHPSSKNERMRAIMQGLASSTDAPKPRSIYGSRDDVFSEPQPNKGENTGLPLPGSGVPNIPSGSLATNSRWHDYRAAVRASHSTDDPESRDPNPMEETSLDHDIFGTDIENLDSTIASSDVASSDFGDFQGRHEPGDAGNDVSTNPNQHLRTAQSQQKFMLLERDCHEYGDDEYTGSLDKKDSLRGKDGIDRKRTIEEKSNDQRLDGMNYLSKNFHTRVLEGDVGLSPQRSPHAANVRGISAPTVTKSTPSLISSSNSKGLSASIINSGSTHRRKAAPHTPNGEPGVRSLHAGQPRREEGEEREGNRYNPILRGSSEADLNYFKLKQGRGYIINDVPLNFRQRGSSFSFRTDNFRRTEDMDHSSTHLNGMMHPQTREEPLEQDLEDRATNDFQNLADQELSKGLLELYDTRGNIDAHSQQEAFFLALDTTQSEKCGDFFIERFVDVMAKYNAIRRQRRDLETALEREITDRETQVRIRKEVLDRNLDELRQAGKGVVRGKSSIVN